MFLSIHDPAPTQMYPLSLHDALPISIGRPTRCSERSRGLAMKATIVLLCMLGSLTRICAQGTLQFAASLTLVEPFPPFPFTVSGEVLFTLDGSTFSYRVRAPVYALWT